jgi:hypothetical protein
LPKNKQTKKQKKVENYCLESVPQLCHFRKSTVFVRLQQISFWTGLILISSKMLSDELKVIPKLP